MRASATQAWRTSGRAATRSAATRSAGVPERNRTCASSTCDACCTRRSAVSVRRATVSPPATTAPANPPRTPTPTRNDRLPRHSVRATAAAALIGAGPPSWRDLGRRGTDDARPAHVAGSPFHRATHGTQAVTDALQTEAAGHGVAVETLTLVGHLEPEQRAVAPQPDSRGGAGGVLGHVLQRLEAAEVHSRLDLGRIAAIERGVDRHPGRRACRGPFEGGTQARLEEQGR